MCDTVCHCMDRLSSLEALGWKHCCWDPITSTSLSGSLLWKCFRCIFESSFRQNKWASIITSHVPACACFTCLILSRRVFFCFESIFKLGMGISNFQSNLEPSVLISTMIFQLNSDWIPAKSLCWFWSNGNFDMMVGKEERTGDCQNH